MAIHLKRAYEPAKKTDGFRVLVERLWPRGITKADAAIDLWLKDAAPSPGLRKWFSHDPAKWREFRKRYFAELDADQTVIDPILDRRGKVTFVFGSKEERFNNAVALKEYVERRKGDK